MTNKYEEMHNTARRAAFIREQREKKASAMMHKLRMAKDAYTRAAASGRDYMDKYIAYLALQNDVALNNPRYGSSAL